MADGPRFAVTAEDAQRAHDLLIPVVLCQVDAGLDPKALRACHTAVDVLCWLLGHQHNRAFAANLRKIEQALVERGLVLRRGPPR